MFTDTRVSRHFLSDREREKVDCRIRLMELVLEEVHSNPRWMELSKGNPWRWFRMHLWRSILMEGGLSDAGKLKAMRMCLFEKARYQNTGDKGLRWFVQKAIDQVKLEEKKGRIGGGAVTGTPAIPSSASGSTTVPVAA